MSTLLFVRATDLVCFPFACSAPLRDAVSEKDGHHAEALGSQRRCGAGRHLVFDVRTYSINNDVYSRR